MDRECAKDYKIPGTDFILKKGEGVVIPIIAIHLDPDYFENPLKFDPDRWSKDKKGSINQSAYIPFGDGPRQCVGMMLIKHSK